MREKESNPFDPPRRRGRTGRIIFYVVSTVLIVLLVAVLFNVIMTRRNGEPPSVFGYSIFIVTTGSMEPEMPPGAAILVHRTEAAELKVGDVITFREGQDDNGKLLVNTHRIVEITQEGGTYAFRTKGDNNDIEDQKIRSESDLIGKALVVMPALGKFFAFIKQPIGLAVCIAVPLLILLIFEIVNLVRLSRRSGEEAELEDTGEAGELAFAEEELAGESFSPAVARRRSSAPETTLPPAEPIPTRVAAPERGATGPFQLPRVVPIQPVSVADGLGGEETQRRLPMVRADLSDPVVSRPAASPAGDYGFHIRAEQEDIPLEREAPPPGRVSYVKPPVRFDPALRRDSTQEFHVSEKMKRSSPASVSVPAPAASRPVPPTAQKQKPKFVADMVSQGRDQFQIEGIDVKVKPDALRLAIDADTRERDISITVTSEYTNVTVGTGENEVNFALFRDENDDGQKVIIQRKKK